MEFAVVHADAYEEVSDFTLLPAESRALIGAFPRSPTSSAKACALPRPQSLARSHGFTSFQISCTTLQRRFRMSGNTREHSKVD